MNNWQSGLDIIIGAISGSFVRLIVQRSPRVIDWVLSGIAGMLIAYFLTPIVLDYFTITNPRYSSGIAFGFGLVGLILMERVLIYARHGKVKVGSAELPPIQKEAKDDK